MYKIIYLGDDLPKIKKEVERAFKTVSNFFSFKVPEITIHICQTRAEFNKRFGEKTQSWIVGNAVGVKEINILSPLAMKNESSHSAKEFYSILTHELTHIFVANLAKNKTVPEWLNEGMAAYVARQHQYKNERLFIDEDFCKKIGTSKGWSDYVHHGAYTVSALFISFLIKKYTFKKIEKLITSLNKNYYYPDFNKIFFSVYKIDLNEMEKIFVEYLNK